MDNNFNFEKEKTTIYISNNIKRNEELFAFALYHRFCMDFLNSLDDDSYFIIYHRLLRYKLSEYCSSISKNDISINSKEFISGYFDTLINSEEYEGEPSLSGGILFIINYNIYIDEVIESLKWVNVVEKMQLSFDSKCDIVSSINYNFDNIDLYMGSFGGIEETEEVRSLCKEKIINYLKEIDTDNFNIGLFNNKIKEIIKEFYKEKIDSKEFNFDNIDDFVITNFIKRNNSNTTKILMLFIPYALSGMTDVFMNYDELINLISEELEISRFKSRMELQKFFKKWKRLENKIDSSDNSLKNKKRVLKNI